jgi:hypothetical protein
VGFPRASLPERRARGRACAACRLVGQLRQCDARGARSDAATRHRAQRSAPRALALAQAPPDGEIGRRRPTRDRCAARATRADRE